MPEMKTLQSENHYLRGITSQTMSRIVLVDTQMIAIRHELEQKRRGFQLMSELALTMMSYEADYRNDFVVVCRRINSALNMQRTVLLAPCKDEESVFSVMISQGYSSEEQDRIMKMKIRIDEKALLDPINPVLITGATPDDYLGSFRKILGLPYLISSPILLHNELIGILVTGRIDEQMPFMPRLGRSDAETVQTVASYLAAIQAGHRLIEAENLANYDPLTRLPNLRRMKEGLHQILTMSRRNGTLGAVLFIDLDGFKTVNDTYGHATGDAVLHSVAQLLSGSMRESDLIGRIGGDEFIAVLSNLTSKNDAVFVAKKIIKKLAHPIDVFGSARCRLGASIGISIFPNGAQNEASLIKAADEAMYSVKKAGKNDYAVADPESSITS
ncbi:MAG: sensor domain-containing diguanylate cyclase [Candidatus Accumulibacter sp.]|jgi:diguanylate cyclase (GGDEF)-like protein|nr:sensor domain-containing diguanylate cyclase [Accumulibacter sp.]